MKKNQAMLMLVGTMMMGQAHAVGSNDLFSAGFSLLGQIGGAVIDKAMADSPEEIEAKRLKAKTELNAKFNDAVAKIESRTDATPLQKEKMVRTTAKQFGMAETMNNMQAQQEIAKNQANDKMFTVGGLAGAVGNAALSTPSAAIARADAAVAAGQPQSQSRNVLAQYDANGGVRPQLTVTQPQQAQIAGNLQGGLNQYKSQIDAELAAAAPKEAFGVTQAVNMLEQDKGRKIFVEFVNGKTLTERMRTAFKQTGYTVVDAAADADVTYQFDGEYIIAAEAGRDGLTESLGALHDNPHPIEAPQKKGGILKGAVGGLLTVFGGGQLVPQTPAAYRQQALIIANRHFEGKDTRVSAAVNQDGAALTSDAMILDAMQGIVAAVGLKAVTPAKEQLAAYEASKKAK